MSDFMIYGLNFVFGALLGIFFFVGLWWTIHKGLVSEWAAVWFLGSLLLRTSVTLGGFWLVSQGHWLKLVVCLLGFLLARFVIMRRFTQSQAEVCT